MFLDIFRLLLSNLIFVLDVFPELALVLCLPNGITETVKPSLEPESSNTYGESKGGGPLANALVEHA